MRLHTYSSHVHSWFRPMDDRRRVLEKNVTPIKNRIMFSEQTLVTKPEQLQELMGTAIKQGLEGLVLKDLKVGATILW